MRAGAVVLGTAILGIAGAYLLRAIAESNTVPQRVVLAVAIIYACLWMVWAARSHTSSFANAIYGITAALMLSALLWESTTRFRVLSPTFAAMVLAAFYVLSLVLSARHHLQVLPWVAAVASIITIWALIIATHDLVALAAALLAIALATEVAVGLGHRLNSRAVPAIAVDLAVCLSIALVTSSTSMPAGVPRVSALMLTILCFGPFAIYGGSFGVRNFGLRRQMTVFEIAQSIAVIMLAILGVMRVRDGLAEPWLGFLSLLLAATCYWGALSRFNGFADTRNRIVCGSCAAALLLASSFLLFSPDIRAPFLCVAAVAAVLCYARTGRLSLGVHADIYLVVAAGVSALPKYLGSALGGTVPGPPSKGVWIVFASILLCFGAGSRRPQDHDKRRLIWLIPGLLLGFAAAALVVVAVVRLAPSRSELNASHLSVVRTVVTCSLALAFGFFGSRWKRSELGWVAYSAVGLGALKLLLEDFRFGNATSLMISLLSYGLVLILLPRIVRH